MSRTVFGVPVSKKQVREMVQRDCVEVEPVAIDVYGHGVPGSEYPSRCLKCGELVGAESTWIASCNGQYWVLHHSPACV